MKKILVLFSILFLSFNINAQDDFSKDTEKLVQIVSENAFKPYVAQFSSMIAEDKQEAFEQELKGTFPELYAEMSKIYMEVFTHDEILELLEFYETPIGKKLADKSGELGQKGMVAGQAWAMKVQEIIAKYQ